MEYILPDKSLLEKHSKELEKNKKYYNLSKLIHKKYSSDKLIFPIGIDKEKEEYYIDLYNKSGILIAGETGSGKSIFLNSIIISLLLKNNPSELKFVFIDPRNVELSAYNDLPHMLADTVFKKEDSISALEYVSYIMEGRRECFNKNNTKNIIDYNNSNIEKMPQIILVIDEAIDILTCEDTKIILKRILSDGNKFGIHILMATNSYFKTVFDMETINMFNCIITFDLASEEQADFIKIKKSNLLSITGEALVKYREDDIIDIQTPYVSLNDIEEVVSFIKNQNINK